METESRSSSRRDALLKLLRVGGVSTAAAGLAGWLSSRSKRPEEALGAVLKPDYLIAPDLALPEMTVARGGEPETLTRRAIQAIGGISRFVARGDVVVVKPNIAWDRTPEQAANTNPQVVAEIVRLSLEAGAKKVIVTDVSCNDPRRCFERSGIAAAARAAGAEVLLPEERRFREVDLRGEVLRTWPVLDQFLNADKMINVPIAKHHSLTECTLGMKNWYGILGGSRHRLHQHIQETLVDLADFMRPTLTVMDAYRVLLRNGPQGGNVSDTVLKKPIIASTDPVALDAYVAKAFWDLETNRLPYLLMAQDRGLGKVDFKSARTSVITSDG